jgi:hypothetical protein
LEHHAYFDLSIHTNQELEILLGSPILERITLHEWPLSCVQRLVLPNGQSWIYKTESGPTVEPEFYARAQSPLLVSARVLFRDSRYACLLLEDIHAPLLEAVVLQEDQAVQTGRRLLAEIAQITGRPPVFLDIATWDHWQALMDGMIQDLDGLVDAGKFEIVNRPHLRAIARACGSPAVKGVFDPTGPYQPGLVHHDLSAENIFLSAGQFRVIDWQRPIFGPPEIDLVLLLASLGFDPRPYVAPGITTITDLLRIHWLTECTRCWFPEGYQTYDRTIARIAQAL